MLALGLHHTTARRRSVRAADLCAKLRSRHCASETYASTLFTYRVLGPLAMRLELATGATAIGGDLAPSSGWVAGARAGLGLDTPVGPIRAEYGYNSLHRGTIFIRVGRWF